jgi:hypothetical protein
MPARYYKRNAQVIVSENLSEVPSSFRATSAQGILIPKDFTGDQLKINFTLSKNQSSELPSDNSISIWNLKGETQSFIKNKNLYVQVLAGYDGEASNIYTGQIDKVEISKKGVNTITKMFVTNLPNIINNAYFNKTYSGLISTRQIINDAIDLTGLVSQYSNLVPSSAQQFNFSYSGAVNDLFKLLLPPLGVNYFIDGDKIKFSLTGKPNEEEAFTINSSTGLVDIPVKTEKGVNITTLLNTGIVLSDYVLVDLDTNTFTTSGRTTNILNQELNGLYKVISVTYEGDTIEGDFVTKLECVSISESSSE